MVEFGNFSSCDVVVVSEEMIFLNRPIRNKNCLWRPCLLMDQDEMSNLYIGPSIDASYQISDQLPLRFQRRRFLRNLPIINKNCLWRPCLLMYQDEMSNLYRGPYNDASYQISAYLGKQFQRRIFFLIGRFKKKFSSETLGQMNWNLVASIYGMSSINMDDFVPIR